METGSSTRRIKISSRAATLRPRRRVRSRRLVGVYVRTQRGFFAFGLCSRVASRAWARTRAPRFLRVPKTEAPTHGFGEKKNHKASFPYSHMAHANDEKSSRIKIFQPCIVTCAPRRSSPGVSNDYRITIETFVRACVRVYTADRQNTSSKGQAERQAARSDRSAAAAAATGGLRATHSDAQGTPRRTSRPLRARGPMRCLVLAVSSPLPAGRRRPTPSLASRVVPQSHPICSRLAAH